ncbi:MAG TPA: DUF4082 domain-containing protein [Thermodesulfovibrionales bacterium]|nr:DUF4082 domain-containing protein [Thermodesulfovibrionales bacterium]
MKRGKEEMGGSVLYSNLCPATSARAKTAIPGKKEALTGPTMRGRKIWRRFLSLNTARRLTFSSLVSYCGVALFKAVFLRMAEAILLALFISGIMNADVSATSIQYVSTLGESGISGSDNSHFNLPSGVAVDNSGNLYVADTYNWRIQKFNSAGVYVSTLGFFNDPLGVAVDNSGNLYVADTINDRIEKFNSTGVYLSTLGISGSDDSHFNLPSGVAVDNSGNLYVADTWNQRIQKFNSVGAYLGTLGVTGAAGYDNCHFYYPSGVAVDNSGNLYVADTFNHRIQKFDGAFGILKTGTPPIIDGDLSEYQDANTMALSFPTGGNTATVRALWDDQALYLAYEVTDTQLNASVTTRDGGVWNDDSVEWFIDTLGDGGGSGNPNVPYMLPDDYHGIVNILNTQYDSRGTASGTPTSSWNGTWQSAVKVYGTINNNTDTDTKYTVEIRIPWTSIGLSNAPAADSALRMSFAVNDKNADSYTSVMWPNITTGAFENASLWQTVKLSSVLASGGITGRVTDANGIGIQDVYVDIYDGVSTYYGAWTDANGYYSAVLPNGSYIVRFDKLGYLTEWYNDKADQSSADLITVTAPYATTGIDAVLRRLGSISGRVTNADGLGIPVQISAYNGTAWYSTKADEQGYYTILGIPTGSYKVFFQEGHGFNPYTPPPQYKYKGQWYNNKTNFPDADLVTVTEPYDKGGINAVLESLTKTSAATLFVAPQGSCGGNTPCFSSIQTALDSIDWSVSGSRTIKVAQGIYYEYIQLGGIGATLEGGWDSTFTSRSQDPSLTIIDGLKDTVFDIFDVTVSVSGFTIRNGSIGILCNNAGLSLTNSIITGHTNYGIVISSFFEPAIGPKTALGTLTNSVIYGNGVGIYVTSYRGGDSYTGVTLVNNTIVKNSSNGVETLGWFDEHGHYGLREGLEMTAVNSIIWGNSAHNLFINDVCQPWSTCPPSITISYSDIGDITGATYTDSGGNISADPLFVNAAAGDFRLTAGSPCIDTGTNDGAPTSDIMGYPRPSDGNGDGMAITDMGAYEYPTILPFTITTAPSGILITVDGTTYTAPKTFYWPEGSNHALSVTSPKDGGPGTQYAFSSWSDNGPQTHTIITPASAMTYTANFTTQYELTTSVSPSGAGSISPSSGFYDSSAALSLSAASNTGYVFSSWSGDCSGTSNSTMVTMTAPKTCTATFTLRTSTYSIWSNTVTPTYTSVNDLNAVEVGVKFRSDTNGYITGIRFYKGAGNTGTHIGNLWTSTGTLLGSVTFTNETTSGWQQATLTNPVAITANMTYVASYHTNTGHYAWDGTSFATSSVYNPPLRALQDGTDGYNGVYKYSSSSSFPNQPTAGKGGANYWVDVVFTP